VRIGTEQVREIKGILGQEFLIVIAVPEGLPEKRGKGVGLAGVEMVSSLSAEAAEYVLVAAASALVEGYALREESEPN
jgi:hypothetical protein